MGRQLNQYLAVLCANLCTFAFSISIGWMGIALVLYDSDDCPLPSGRVQLDELGWIASILGIGGLVGTIAGGWIADQFGRKYSLLAMAVPQIASYLLIIYAQNVYYLYASRFLSGFVGGAVFVVIPLMVAEIAEDSIRGALSTILMMAFSAGELIGYTTGHFLEYETGAWFCLSLPILFVVFYSFMPETPYYLMKTNRMEEAEKSLRFYRNFTGNPKADQLFQHEFSKLKCAYTELQDKDPESLTNVPLKFTDFINRPFAICCVLMFAHELDGEFAMVNYASVIFSKSGSTFSPGMSSIIVTAIQFIGSYVSSLFIDRLGRKILLMVSFGGAAICHVVMATYIFVDTSTDIDVKPFDWVPVVSFSAMIFIVGCGALSIPYVILSEILPDKIRNWGITFCSCISWALIFVVVKIFPPLSLLIHLYGCIYVFAVCCFATVIYVLIAVPETKGKSLDEILLILKRK